MPPYSNVSERGPSLDDDPTLSEYDGIRYLHFGTEWVQGAMRVAEPSELVLAYTQQMMGWLLFLEPRRKDKVAILGLGAGSLLRFVLKHTRASTQTVEWNPAVTAICRMYFRLPESSRSEIWHGDADRWAQDNENIGRYTALMVDLYDAHAQGPVCDSLAFYQGCYRALADTGIMTVNLFGSHESFAPNLDNIRQAFGGRMLELPEIDAGNRVVLAFKGPVLDVSAGRFMERAEEVESQYGLPARRWARAILSGKRRRDTLVV